MDRVRNTFTLMQASSNAICTLRHIPNIKSPRATIRYEGRLVPAEQLFFCKFFDSVRVESGDGEKFLGFQREWVVLGRER